LPQIAPIFFNLLQNAPFLLKFTSKCSKSPQITTQTPQNRPKTPKNHPLNSNFPSKSRGLGTFSGVFTPTVLSCVGVILFLRIGWAVGNVGLLQVLAILIIAFVGK
jgi:hypothetical protein